MQGKVYGWQCCHTMRIVSMLGRKKLCSGLINIHYVKDGIHSCHVLKSEILVVKNHPLITMLLRHMLYVGEHTYWYDNLTTIGEHDTELATHIEIKPLDTNIYIRNLPPLFAIY